MAEIGKLSSSLLYSINTLLFPLPDTRASQALATTSAMAMDAAMTATDMAAMDATMEAMDAAMVAIKY